ncbi:MAG TPA: hypothetical protein VHY22_04695, partial [Chthoniobacteraceae bacterium]|nr:hypothetical protein [Chthoniobacteraceae bacterium]
MKNAAVARQIQKLQALQKNPDVLGCPIEVQSQWARYLCVLVAGLLENAITELYADYCLSCSNKPVARYANARLETIQNPKADRFLQVAR